MSPSSLASAPSSSINVAGQPKRRIRTPAQLERKRAIDRQSQQSNRQKNHDLMDKMEKMLARLEGKFCSISKALQDIQNCLVRENFVVECGSVSSETLYETSASSLIRGPSMSSCSNESTVDANVVMQINKSLAPETADTNQIPPQLPVVGCGESLDESGHPISFPEPQREDGGSCGLSAVADPSLQTDMSIERFRLPHRDILLSQEPQSPCARVTSASDDPLFPASYCSPSSSSGFLCSKTHSVDTEELFACSTFVVLSRAHLKLLSDFKSAQRIPRNPTLANLLLLDIDSNPVVNVLGSSFRRKNPPKVADLMSTYFIMYRLLRWRMHPDPDSYEDVPSWYRPSYLQENIPHDVSCDFWAWPKLRDMLLTGVYTYHKRKFNIDMCEAITVEWPESKELLVKQKTRLTVVLNPEFESHVMEYKNWKLRRCFADKYPELVNFVNIASE